MNIAQSERSERVFSSTGPSDLTSDNAKFFAYPFQSESTYRVGFGYGQSSGWNLNETVDFSRFAFKSLPVCGNEGLWFSAHLTERDELFTQAWSIYTEAFTAVERRTRQEQIRVMRDPRYRFSAVMHEHSVIGVLAWWNLPGFRFVEHFAISSTQRSGGFGRRAITLLQTHVASPIVLDVEPFSLDHQAVRRVAFYERLGFSYCMQSVFLPAYAGKSIAPTNFMAWRTTLDRKACERVFDTVTRVIYKQDVAVPALRKAAKFEIRS